MAVVMLLAGLCAHCLALDTAQVKIMPDCHAPPPALAGECDDCDREALAYAQAGFAVPDAAPATIISDDALPLSGRLTAAATARAPPPGRTPLHLADRLLN